MNNCRLIRLYKLYDLYGCCLIRLCKHYNLDNCSLIRLYKHYDLDNCSLIRLYKHCDLDNCSLIRLYKHYVDNSDNCRIFSNVLFLFLVLHFPLREVGSLCLGKAQQPQEQRYPFLSACVVFSCVPTVVWLPKCWCMRWHTGAVRTPSESLHWKLTLGERSLAAPGTRTRVSIAPGFSVRHTTN